MQPLYTSGMALALIPIEWGYIAILGLTLAFGTMYLPTKKYDIGNGEYLFIMFKIVMHIFLLIENQTLHTIFTLGMIFQWLMSTSLGFCLFAIHVCFGSQRIWSLTLLSGILWSTGDLFARVLKLQMLSNLAVVPIIQRLGMGVGMLIWSMANLLMGWASSRFGWFGIKPEEPKNSTLNIIGVVFASLSVVVYAFITPFSTRQGPQNTSPINSDDIVVSPESEASVTESTGDADPLLQVQVSPIQRFWKSKIGQRRNLDSPSVVLRAHIILSQANAGKLFTSSFNANRLFTSFFVQFCRGVLLSILSGLLYGLVFVPIIYVQENYAMSSKRGIDYAASLGLGAFLASTTYLVLYFLILRLKDQITAFFSGSEESPSTEPNVGTTPFNVLFLPAMLAGALCAIGQACWLVANEALQAAITFPIAATLPGALATLLGTVFYREVHVRIAFFHSNRYFVL
ncbi:unnamed protein product [Rodentolepis nana]|uniref:Solute carrier family 40 protein n=1 Tax=Rodentolepis nana TaxID=102285 RepID=A0A158QHQ0_RODNA|nr:unnamed protein product [Rodentolepis nana]